MNITTPTDRDVVLTRTFDAPPQMVFDALTKPDLLRRWYGPAGWSLIVCEVDLRVGGPWRFTSRKPSGKTVGQHGVYVEIVPGERLVNTELWDDWDAGETLVTTVLAGHDGRTMYTSTVRFPSKDVRDTVLKSGFEPGADELYGRLDELLVAQQELGGR